MESALNNEGSVHKALGLPRRYRVMTSITGQLRVSWRNETKLIDLRFLRTDTHGQNAVWAVRVVNGDNAWREINGAQFQNLALAIITGQRVDVSNNDVWDAAPSIIE